jgi:hypothetical protein
MSLSLHAATQIMPCCACRRKVVPIEHRTLPTGSSAAPVVIPEEQLGLSEDLLAADFEIPAPELLDALLECNYEDSTAEELAATAHMSFMDLVTKPWERFNMSSAALNPASTVQQAAVSRDDDDGDVEFDMANLDGILSLA